MSQQETRVLKVMPIIGGQTVLALLSASTLVEHGRSQEFAIVLIMALVFPVLVLASWYAARGFNKE